MLDIRLSSSIVVQGDDMPIQTGMKRRDFTLSFADFAGLGTVVPPPELARPYTRNTTLGEIKDSGLIGKFIVGIAIFGAKRQARNLGTTLSDPGTSARIAEEGLKGMAFFNLGLISESTLNSIVRVFNGFRLG